eukprot:UN01146
MPSNVVLRKQVLILYKSIMRHAYRCSNLEFKKYILNEARLQFTKYKDMKDEIEIRERIYDGESRILCYLAYGDPYPRSVRDVQRVWKMGAGYSKRGKVHQLFSKRENKFNTHDRRTQQHVKTGQGKIRKLNRKPGEYDLPVFHKDMRHDVPHIVKDHIEKQNTKNVSDKK